MKLKVMALVRSMPRVVFVGFFLCSCTFGTPLRVNEPSVLPSLVQPKRDKRINQQGRTASSPVYRSSQFERRRSVGNMRSLAAPPNLKCRCEYPNEGIYVSEPNLPYLSVNGLTVLPPSFAACQGVVFVCQDTVFDGALWDYDCSNIASGAGSGGSDLSGYVVVLPSIYFLCQCKETSNVGAASGADGSRAMKEKIAKTEGGAKKDIPRKLVDQPQYRRHTKSSGAVTSFQEASNNSKGNIKESRNGSSKSREIQFVPPQRCTVPTPTPPASARLSASIQPRVSSRTFAPTITWFPTVTYTPSITWLPTASISPSPVVVPETTTDATSQTAQPTSGARPKPATSTQFKPEKIFPGVALPDPPRYNITGIAGLSAFPTTTPVISTSEILTSPTSEPTSRTVPDTLEPSAYFIETYPTSSPADEEKEHVLPGIKLPARPDFNITGDAFGLTTAPSSAGQTSPTSHPTTMIVPDTSEPSAVNDPNHILPGVTLPERPNYNITGEAFGLTQAPSKSPAKARLRVLSVSDP